MQVKLTGINHLRVIKKHSGLFLLDTLRSRIHKTETKRAERPGKAQADKLAAKRTIVVES
jgi:hypothetical protein